MTISSSSFSFAVRNSHSSNVKRQVRTDFKALKYSLATGDLPGAKTNFSTLTQDAQIQSRGGQGNNTEAIGANAITEFSTLKSALESDDLSGAQKAFTSMAQDLGAKAHNLAGAPAAFTAMVKGLQSTDSAGSILSTTV
jgi:hypothetical protein